MYCIMVKVPVGKMPLKTPTAKCSAYSYRFSETEFMFNFFFRNRFSENSFLILFCRIMFCNYVRLCLYISSCWALFHYDNLKCEFIWRGVCVNAALTKDRVLTNYYFIILICFTHKENISIYAILHNNIIIVELLLSIKLHIHYIGIRISDQRV